jgi:plastocyanin
LRTGFAGLVVTAAALLVFPACATTADPAGTSPTVGRQTPATSASDAPTSAPPTNGGTRIEVSQTEYSITLPRTDFTSGTYIFVVDNLGSGGHDLAIKGPGVDLVKRLPDGTQAEITVTFQPGTYELWCSIGDHRVRGMQRTVTIAG